MPDSLRRPLHDLRGEGSQWHTPTVVEPDTHTPFHSAPLYAHIVCAGLLQCSMSVSKLTGTVQTGIIPSPIELWLYTNALVAQYREKQDFEMLH